MHPYSIFLNVSGRRCLVVGGGPVAARKAAALLEAGAALHVVAPEFSPEFESLSAVVRMERHFNETDLDGVFLAVAATDNCETNATVAAQCAERGILCNVADDPEAGDFITPAVIRRGDLMAALTTGGAAPALAARLRSDMDACLPADTADYVAFLREARQRAEQEVTETETRHALARFLASGEGYECFHEKTGDERRQWLDQLLAHPKTSLRG